MNEWIYRFSAIVGIAVILFIAWLFSENKKKFPVRIVVWGLILQFSFAFLAFNVPGVVHFFDWLGAQIRNFLAFSMDGARFVFGDLVDQSKSGFIFAFMVLPTIVFFSAFMAVLYYYGIMQKVVYGLAWVMNRTLKTSPTESLAAAANVFFGQTEAVLTVRPYLNSATHSEIFAMMVGGFVTIAGAVLAAYIQMGIPATDLIIASIISAPAGLMIAKILVPPTGQEAMDMEHLNQKLHMKKAYNVLEAAVNGTEEGVRLAVNIGAMLIVFLAFIAIFDAMFAWMHGVFLQYLGWGGFPGSLREFFGVILSPLGYLVGVPWKEAHIFGSLVGTKVALNEFVAYMDLAQLIKEGAISSRTEHIATFALCGFANFGSVAIQIGGIGGLVPERKSEIASIALKAMFGGVLANLLTAAVVSVLL